MAVRADSARLCRSQHLDGATLQQTSPDTGSPAEVLAAAGAQDEVDEAQTEPKVCWPPRAARTAHQPVPGPATRRRADTPRREEPATVTQKALDGTRHGYQHRNSSGTRYSILTFLWTCSPLPYSPPNSWTPQRRRQRYGAHHAMTRCRASELTLLTFTLSTLLHHTATLSLPCRLSTFFQRTQKNWR